MFYQHIEKIKLYIIEEVGQHFLLANRGFQMHVQEHITSWIVIEKWVYNQNQRVKIPDSSS